MKEKNPAKTRILYLLLKNTIKKGEENLKETKKEKSMILQLLIIL